MSVTYPLDWPSYVNPTSCTFKATAVVGVSTSPFTLASQVQVWPGRRWTASVTMPNMSGRYARAFYSFLVKLNGKQGTFLFGDPSATTPNGTALGTPLVNGEDQTGKSLITDGWTVNQDELLLAGDYIQLGTSSNARLYMVTSDASSDSDGAATLEIWPPLYTSPDDDQNIFTQTCQAPFRLTSNEITVDLSLPDIHAFSFDIEEAL